MGISVHPNAQTSSEFRAMGGGSAYNLKIFKANEDRSMSCGVWVVNKAELISFEYPCSEYTIVLEGEFRVEEEGKPGEVITLKAGDVMCAEKGTKVKWSSPSTGKGKSLPLPTQTFMPKPLTLKMVIIVAFYVTDRDVPGSDSMDLKDYIV